MTETMDGGFCESRLEQAASFLQATYIDSGRLPCLDLAIERAGRPVRRFTLGWLDIEQRVPLPEDTVYRIYSMTKPVTSVAAMMLVEKGLLSLEDPVSRYIPAWSDLGVHAGGTIADGFTTIAPWRPMAIIDLFRHTSGLTYDFQRRSAVDQAYRDLAIGQVHGDRDLAATAAALANIPLDYAPGEAWNYSFSVDILGYIVELVSGLPLDVHLDAAIFRPLGMHDTGFSVREDQLDRFATCYRLDEAGSLTPSDRAEDSLYRNRPTLLSGGGGLVSTTADYMRFAAMLAGGGATGDVRLLSPTAVAMMGLNHLPKGKEIADLSRSTFSESVYAGMGFGLGMAVITDPARTGMLCSKGEMHWGGMASTLFWVDPAEALSVVCMSQFVPSTAYPIRRQLRNLVYGSLVETRQHGARGRCP